jgi:hypothetical protein
MQTFRETSESILEQYSKMDCLVSFTMDGWTSPNNIAFLGMTAHYIYSNFRIHAQTLDFVSLPDEHTGANIYDAFTATLNRFRLSGKILAITLDNASINNTFVERLGADDSQFKSSTRFEPGGTGGDRNDQVPIRENS